MPLRNYTHSLTIGAKCHIIVTSQLRQVQHLIYDNRLTVWVLLFVLYSLVLYIDILIISAFIDFKRQTIGQMLTVTKLSV